jgi:hypothetical protein
MFNILTRSDYTLYNYNKYLYYILLFPYAIVCLFIAIYMTIVSLPSAVYNVTRDKYYLSTCSRISDQIFNYIFGFLFLYNLYYFELLKAL